MKSIKKTINDENVVFDYSGGVFLENLKTKLYEKYLSKYNLK